MADIFSAKPGRVVAVTGHGLPLNIVIGNPPTGGLPDSRWKGFNGFKAIIQNVGLSGRSGVQFMHTLRDYIYVYVFGERMGDLVIGGLAFHSTCLEAFNPLKSSTGFEDVFNFYQSFRITSYPLPLAIAIGATVSFNAFLLGGNVQIVNPETNLAQFSLAFQYVPNQINLLAPEVP